MAIRGETTAGAQAGASVGMHLSSDFPEVPTGADTKSAAIAAELQSFVTAISTDITTYNTSLDQAREGMVAAPRRVDAADREGAAVIQSSGGTYTI
ncbi:hypothetical protein [Mycolicibacterium iranicum]|uniref:PE domain-containing protein n=1 Tax=Mycolicibacterium iranicum TaxID=912594 RepID=A0ABT4HKD4_MYCIR|nr:hypothetical protein [Mycolicibacterium iranicum]MCZ0730655.1 hypothetical protein [Mycolicibacterium iranicum]